MGSPQHFHIHYRVNSRGMGEEGILRYISNDEKGMRTNKLLVHQESPVTVG